MSTGPDKKTDVVAVADRITMLRDELDGIEQPTTPLVELFDRCRAELAQVEHQWMFERALTPQRLAAFLATAVDNGCNIGDPVVVHGPEGHHETPRMVFHVIAGDVDRFGRVVLTLTNEGLVGDEHQKDDQ
ncbi:MAG: hypothetical protein ACRD03_01775 [Acidimicrobiales bacterium]